MNLHNALAEAPLFCDLLPILNSGDFTLPSDPVGPGEVTIGTMNPYELALYTLIASYITQGNTIVNRCSVEGIYIGPPEDENAWQSEIRAMKERIETAYSNLWLSLKERFRTNMDPDTVSGLGIRQGGAVVTMPTAEPTLPAIEVRVIRLDQRAEPDEESPEVGLGERIRKLLLN